MLALSVCSWASQVAAEPAQAPGSTRSTGSLLATEPGEYRVDFSAGRVDVDVKLNELELADDVIVVVDRYRLSSERLKLSRGDRGIVVDGEGRVAFCRCADPPVAVSFSSATVAPPTDLLIEDPALRVGGVPVFWLPYLWLRSPDRVGLLPPRISYSGEDGLLAGGGVHLPYASGKSFVDLEAGGYFEGGVDTRLRWSTPSNRVRVRVDHLGDTMLGVDARGVSHVPGFSSAAYRIDALRGARALEATPTLFEAAQRFDRARAQVGRHHGRVFYGMGFDLTSPRGDSLDSVGAWGPSATLGVGEALGGVGDLASSVSLTTLRHLDETISLLEQRGALRLHARPGPAAFEFELGDRAGVLSSPLATARFALIGGRAELGVPLRRRFGAADPLARDPLVHYLTPLLVAAGHQVLGSDGVVLRGADERLGRLSAGLRTSLGRWAAGTSLQFEGHAGWVRTDAESLRLASGELLGQGDWYGASLRAASRLDTADAWTTLSQLRLGPEFSHHLTLYAEGRRELDPALARAMTGDLLTNEPRHAWYDAPGLSAGAETMLRLSSTLSSAFGGDYDVERERLLGVRGSLAYRHSCGCLATVAWAGHRLGRRGVDAWLTVDLIP